MIRYLLKQLLAFLINMYRSSGISGARPNTKISPSVFRPNRGSFYIALQTPRQMTKVLLSTCAFIQDEPYRWT